MVVWRGHGDKLLPHRAARRRIIWLGSTDACRVELEGIGIARRFPAPVEIGHRHETRGGQIGDCCRPPLPREKHIGTLALAAPPPHTRPVRDARFWVEGLGVMAWGLGAKFGFTGLNFLALRFRGEGVFGFRNPGFDFGLRVSVCSDEQGFDFFVCFTARIWPRPAGLVFMWRAGFRV